MRVITVVGKKEIGKTTFIKYVFYHLLKRGGKVLFYKTIGQDELDFHSIMLWKKRMIAFCSVGDADIPYWSIIENGLDFGKTYSADILINALSISDFTVEEYKNKFNKDEIVFFFMIQERLSKFLKRINCWKILQSIKQTTPVFWKFC